MRKLIANLIVVAALSGVSAPVRAVLPDEVMSDPAKEARARHLSQELRCMVCQNQSIDDSEAPLARDLRLLVRERIASGDSDAQVIDFLVARYGEFVLLEAAFRAPDAAAVACSAAGAVRWRAGAVVAGAAAEIGIERGSCQRWTDAGGTGAAQTAYGR